MEVDDEIKNCIAELRILLASAITYQSGDSHPLDGLNLNDSVQALDVIVHQLRTDRKRISELEGRRK